MTVSAKLTEVKQEDAVIAECITCDWRFTYEGTSKYPATRALAAARTHAARKRHETIVHRSTAYDGRRQP